MAQLYYTGLTKRGYMPKIIDLKGMKFGRLKVICFNHINHGAHWKCKCECKNIVVVRADQLKTGNTRSCGCFNKEMVAKRNKILWDPIYKDDHVLIPLTKGKFTKIDKDKLSLVKDYKWRLMQCCNKGYSASKIKGKNVYMHKLLLRIENNTKLEGDHINGNSLDNTMSNLRTCTRTQNARNRSKNHNKKFKGAYLKKNGKWTSQIRINYKHLYLGSFDTEEDAAKAYDAAAKKYFKKFARLNFPNS